MHYRTLRLVASTLILCGGVTANASRNGVAAHQEITLPLQLPVCGYRVNSAHFNTCTCGRYADEVVEFARRSEEPLLVVIDGYGWSTESPGIEVKRAASAHFYFVHERGFDPGKIVLRWHRLETAPGQEYCEGMRISVIRRGTPLPTIELSVQ